MEQEEGLRILASEGWLGATPEDFRQAILSRGRWERLEPGAPIQVGGGQHGEMTGLASGIMEIAVRSRPRGHAGHAFRASRFLDRL